MNVLELIEYSVNGSIWRWVGITILVMIFMSYGVSGIVNIVSRLIIMIMVLVRGWDKTGNTFSENGKHSSN